MWNYVRGHFSERKGVTGNLLFELALGGNTFTLTLCRALEPVPGSCRGQAGGGGGHGWAREGPENSAEVAAAQRWKQRECHRTVPLSAADALSRGCPSGRYLKMF